MTRPFFHKERLSHFEIFDRNADDAIHQLKERLKEGHPVDVQVCESPQVYEVVAYVGL